MGPKRSRPVGDGELENKGKRMGAALQWRKSSIMRPDIEQATSQVGKWDEGGMLSLEEIPAGAYEIVNGQIIMKPVADNTQQVAPQVGGETSDKSTSSTKIARGGKAQGKPEPPQTKQKKRPLEDSPAQAGPAKKKAVNKETTTTNNAAEKKEAGKSKASIESKVSAPKEETGKNKKSFENKVSAPKDEAGKNKKSVENKVSAPQKKALVASLVPETPEIDMESWNEFGLHADLTAGLARLRYSNPTPIQRLTIPKAMAGSDVLGAAATGSGKTLAFGLPMLSSLLDRPVNGADGVGALVLTPTRELAVQVCKHLSDVLAAARQSETNKAKIRVAQIVGGMALVKQERVLSQRPEVVVATPGRLWQLISDGEEHLSKLATSLRFLVVDEADRMFDKGHFPDLLPLVKLFEDARKADAVKPSVKRQTFLFSATLMLAPGEASELRQRGKGRPQGKSAPKKGAKENESPLVDLMNKIGSRGKPVIISVVDEDQQGDRTTSAPAVESKPVEGPAKGSESAEKGEGEPRKKKFNLPASLTLCSASCTDKSKDEYLYYFLQQYGGRSLVFVNTISNLRRVSNMLKLLQLENVTTLHANMQQRQRLQHLDRFVREPTGVLVASDVAARGLDIKGIDFVIQYGVPSSLDTFVHRAGRTARASLSGLCMTLVGPTEVEQFARIRTALTDVKPFKPFPIPMTYMPMVKERVALARRIELLERKQNEQRADRDWFTKNAELADVILDDSIVDSIGGGEGDGPRGKNRSQVQRKIARGDREQSLDPREKESRSLKVRLSQFLSERVIPRFSSTKYLDGSDVLHKTLLNDRLGQRDALRDLSAS